MNAASATMRSLEHRPNVARFLERIKQLSPFKCNERSRAPDLLSASEARYQNLSIVRFSLFFAV